MQCCAVQRYSRSRSPLLSLLYFSICSPVRFLLTCLSNSGVITAKSSTSSTGNLWKDRSSPVPRSSTGMALQDARRTERVQSVAGHVVKKKEWIDFCNRKYDVFRKSVTTGHWCNNNHIFCNLPSLPTLSVPQSKFNSS